MSSRDVPVERLGVWEAGEAGGDFGVSAQSNAGGDEGDEGDGEVAS